uniref:Capsid protein n=1 Tax=viral metagenome TaxID=1070528 RepID=A0A6M3L6R2_9ZZZZ
MNRREYPYTTVTEGISVFDRDNQYRPLQWLDAPNEIDWLDKEDNGLLLTILDKMPSLENEFDNPVVNWTEDTRMDTATKFNSAMAVTDTYLDLVDPYIVVVNSFMVIPNTGEVVRVDAVDYDKSDGWTNGAGDTANVTVTRGMNGTAAVAAAVGDYVIALPAYMAELSDPRGGVGRLPGESQHNFISLASKTFRVGRVQENSGMLDNWGQVPKAAIDTILDMRRELSYALLFQARATYLTANEGQMYISQGALHYIRDGYLDLGTMASKMTWPIFNDYLEARFEADASSLQKTMLCGQTLFSTLQKLMRELGRLSPDQPYFEPELKTMAFQMKTDGGYIVNVLLDKYGLSSRYGLASWGFLLDMAHIQGAKYKGLGFQWFQNIQDNRSVMLREDTFMGSFSLIMKHQKTHGVVRGGSPRIVTR